MKNIKITVAKSGFEVGRVYPCHENTAQMLIGGGFGFDVATIKEHGIKKPLNKIDPAVNEATTKE